MTLIDELAKVEPKPIAGEPQAYKRAVIRMVIEEKVDGLESDLESAVQVAFAHGAHEWVRMNYPAQYRRLTDHE